MLTCCHSGNGCEDGGDEREEHRAGHFVLSNEEYLELEEEKENDVSKAEEEGYDDGDSDDDCAVGIVRWQTE
eukprot:scaffold7649_cov154-Skeletonema_marinoi.AAC.19